MAYLGRSGAGAEAQPATFFDRGQDELDAAAATQAWGRDRHHFRFIVAPEHGERIADLRDFTRDVMRRISDDLGEPALTWIATCHFDTGHPHSHVLVRGRRASGKDLVIPRDYVAFGFRARAQEVAQERLGDLSRADAEKRVWRETQADRFTSFDRRLLQSADDELCVPDGVGTNDAWAALTRGRLRHLETLGLAEREGRQYRLAPDLEPRLRRLQLKSDVIRTLNAQRLERGRDITELGGGRVRGKVTARGHNDELGAAGWVIVEDAAGAGRYARLSVGQALPKVGRTVEVIWSPKGAEVATPARDMGLER